MNLTIGQFMEMVKADDHYFLNIKMGRQQIYYGYSEEITEEILNFKIESIYVDWVDEAFGIQVKQTERENEKAE